MRACSHEDTIATLIDSGLPLALSCHRCRYRSLFGVRQMRACEGHYRAVHRLPLLCRCGSKDLDKYVLDAEGEARDFLQLAPPQAEVRPLPPRA